MRTFFQALLLAAAAAFPSHTQERAMTDGAGNSQQEAEKLYARGAFAKAHELYAAIDPQNLSKNEAAWVAFRLLDTEWRALTGGQRDDDSKLQAVENKLEASLAKAARAEDHTRVWAETEESLGDFHWQREASRNWWGAWPHYQLALDWWAGANVDEKLARERYLAICWKAAKPHGLDSSYTYGQWGNYLPVEVLENVLTIALTDSDKVQAHYFLAMALKNQGADWEQQTRIPEEFEAALALGKKTDWYDTALFEYASYLESNGRPRQLADGNWTRDIDYAGALTLYKRLLHEFGPGESRWTESAKQRIADITRPQLSLGVSNIFLPGSQLPWYLSWRNLKSIDFELHQIDLTEAVSFTEAESSGEWMKRIELPKAKLLDRWSKGELDKGDYQPGNSQEQLKPLPIGAYILSATAGKDAEGNPLTARELVLVTDAAVVVKTGPNKTVVWVTDATTGAPIANAKTTLWTRTYDNGPAWHRQTLQADANGLAIYPREDATIAATELFAAAALGDRQAFSLGAASSRTDVRHSWKITAYTDRPAYRPGDEASWKLLARINEGGAYTTPANRKLEYEITDPQGSKVASGKVVLNAFGSAWGQLKLTEKMPLGAYQISFYTEGHHDPIGSATLLRLEEYKLPEFTVAVKTPEGPDGRKKTYRLGEKVTADIQADSYFGGAVANADVQVLIYQTPSYTSWAPPRDYPWFYEDRQQQNWYGGGQVIKQVQLKTDATGKASITFDTPRSSQQDLEFRIEARVTDASRREVTGSGTVKVSRQRFVAVLTPKHAIYRPNDKVLVAIKTIDANAIPLAAEGTVSVTRERWWEIWLGPKGNEIKGPALEALRKSEPDFATKGYRFKFRGYQHDELTSQKVTTNANGDGELSFSADKDGYYLVHWVTPEAGRSSIKADAAVWVATESSSEIGYRQGGLDILVDKDTVSAGSTTPVMLHTDSADRWVLFTVAAANLDRVEVVHLEGTMKLLQVAIEDAYTPNLFLGAEMVRDQGLTEVTRQLIVPPTKHYLNVSIEPDKKEYQSREPGTWSVRTLDDQGHPVAAEVSLGVVDESVYAIQDDLAPDPRQFFFGEKRADPRQTRTSFNEKSYAMLRPPPIEPGPAPDNSPEGTPQLEEDRDDGEMANRAAGRMQKPMMSMEMAAAPVASAPAPLGGPASKMASAAMRKESAAQGGPPPADSGSGGAPGEPAVVVRTDFRATAFWKNDVVTGADGKAQVKFSYPDSLTSWRATARAATAGSSFGIERGTVRTRLPLLVRLQAPRFFTVNDKPLISAIINNNTNSNITTSVELVADGLELAGKTQTIVVPANGSARADWKASASQAGEAKLKVIAKGGGFADAMEKSFPVYEHGVDKLVVKSGKLRGEGVQVELDLPRERRAGSTELTVQVAPSLAVTMLDALPYLIDYPYGCVEQTMSRFMPAVVVRNALGRLGLDRAQLEHRIFGGIDPQSIDKTHPGGGARKDLKDLDSMVKAGLERLYDFQHGDGGFGWWQGGESDRYMTAYVLWGLTLAREAGVSIKPAALQKAASYIDVQLVNETANPDKQAWMLFAISSLRASDKKPAGKLEKKAFDRLWENHKQLNAYTRALLALAAKNYNYIDQAKTLAENLENGVERDNETDTSIVQVGAQSHDASAMATAHWGKSGFWWRWSDSPVETTSFALMALAAIDPKSPLVEQSMSWLVKNRRGAQWSNTKDTAIAVLGLTKYLQTSGELGGDLEYSLRVNGKEIATRKVSKADVLSAPSSFSIDPGLVGEKNKIELTRIHGAGPLYFSAQARFFSLEEPITPAGNELFVRRSYFKKVGRKTLLKGTVYDSVPLEDGGQVNSGDRIEVVLAVEAKNDYEYLLFEDLKPAGFEAVELQSGSNVVARAVRQSSYERNYGKLTPGAHSKGLSASTDEIDYTGASHPLYQELRDRKVALFADKLEQGIWEIRYELRAEVPGEFHGLPLLGQAMYVPEIRANGAEIRVEVVDR